MNLTDKQRSLIKESIKVAEAWRDECYRLTDADAGKFQSEGDRNLARRIWQTLPGNADGISSLKRTL